MKRTPRTEGSLRNARAAFTLMELLVSIAIILILAGFLTPVVQGAFKKAKIGRARSEMSTIVTAIKAYANEYTFNPVGPDNGYGDHVYGGAWGYDMSVKEGNPRRANYVYNILRGLDTTNNPKKMVFLEIPEASLQGTCTLEGHAHVYTMDEGYFLDPWGNPYLLIMDTDFDDQIGGLQVDGLDGKPVLVYDAIEDYIKSVSPIKDSGKFPGVRMGVMCFGPTPGDTNSFMMSWR